MYGQRIMRHNPWYSGSLVLLLTLALAFGLAKPVQAATTTISDQPSCVAIGGTWQSFNVCRIGNLTIAAGDTLTIQVPTDFDGLTNNGTLNVQADVNTSGSFTNNAGATVNVDGRLSVTQFVNRGTINITNSMTLFSTPAVNESAGRINVRSGGTLTVNAFAGTLTNNGAITVDCGGTMVYDAADFSGNLPKYYCISNATSCAAFGGTWESFNVCRIGNLTIAAGDTLTIQAPTDFVGLTNNGTLNVQADVNTSGSFTNNAGATVNVDGRLSVTQFVNRGTINITSSLTLLSTPAINESTGRINVRSGGTLTVNAFSGTLTNNGVISVECGGTMVYAAANFSGNPPKHYCINNASSCAAFGGTWESFNVCRIGNLTIAAGDTLTIQVPTDFVGLTNNGTLNVQADVNTSGSFTNNAGATVNVDGRLSVTQFVNRGTINITNSMTLFSTPAVNESTGRINVRSGGTLTVNAFAGTLTNNGTISVECGGTTVYDAADFSGNPPQNNCVYTIVNDEPSCIAAGGTFTAAISDCAIPTINVAAGAILEFASSSSLNVIRVGSITNNGTFKANSFSVQVTSFNNEGTIEVLRSMTAMGTLQNNGVINIHGGLTVRRNATLTNNGTITVACSGRFTNDGSYSGTPPQYEDCSGPIATPLQSPAANAAGWNKDDVTVDWHWVDQSGLNTANCTTRSTSSGEGTLTLTATCQDIIGNVGNASYTVKVDKTAPTLSVTGKPNNPSNVTTPVFTFAATDNSGGSGIAQYNCLLDGQQTLNCTSPFTAPPLADGSHLLILSAYDVAGNSTPFVYNWTINTVRPTVTVNQAAGQADPATSNPVLFTASFSKPVINFTSDDVTLGGTADLSGATVTISGGNVNYTIRVDGVAGNGTVTAAVAADRATDTIGNGNTASTSTDNSVTFISDSTPPVITPSVVGTAGANGWYTSDVNVTWRVADNESAITNQSGCDAQSITSDTSGVTITCAATSLGGSNSQSVTIKRDATAPTITFVDRTAANTNGWNNGAVTVNWNCSDATSGVVAASVNQTVSGEGANQSATGACTDNAGNSANDTQNDINIDKTAPTISVAATTDSNPAGWYNSDVVVHFTCADSMSGVTNCPADQPLSSEGSEVASTAQTITDLAGNSSAASNVVMVKIDKTAPTISAAATTQPNSNGWYNGDVTVQFTCADALSGVANCPTDQLLNSEGATVASPAQTVSDQAGNSSAASNVVTVQIDKTAPVVTVTGVSDGASYTLGSVPTAGCSTTDAGSGVATQATLSITGGNPDGSGSFTATCSGAMDNAGNNSGASVSYTVAYNWSGFLQPVDNLPVVNTVNAGVGIPVKFSLGGDFGLNISVTGYPASQQVSCGSGGGGSSSPIEETVTAGNNGLQYNAATQTYTYLWKTDKAWAGTCRQLIVKLIDGTEHIALFQFNGKGRSAGASEAEGEAIDGETVAPQQQLFLPLVSNQ